MRLDSFVAQMLEQTRSQVVQLIKKGFVHVEDATVLKPGLKLKIGQKITLQLPAVETVEQKPVDFDVEILYEDDDLLVVNKPSGLVVHDAPSVKEATLVDWLRSKGIALSTISGEERHGIVHRLDKGTTGVMVVAKTNEAHRALSKQLEDKTMGRYYLAVVEPPLKEELTIVEKPIARNPHNRIKMGVVAGGKEAKTAFLRIQESNTQKQQLIACKLFTGRTHQIRVHLESMSRQIVGDNLYGGGAKQSSTEHILLHALTIYFQHPTTKSFMEISAGFDSIFTEYLRKKFSMEKIDVSKISKDIIQQFHSRLS
ncbi:MAG: RluA family pseudouridine synthase [Epsilonproteobacteria bacterium]|nr:RluA family pseudouridine synthase [Campylobacterota bacterium]